MGFRADMLCREQKDWTLITQAAFCVDIGEHIFSHALVLFIKKFRHQKSGHVAPLLSSTLMLL
jgi:hypothetical protein